MNELKLNTIQILLVEDDPADQKLVKTAFRNAKIANDLSIAGSGEDALDLLAGSGPGGPDKLRPDLILLDLNMPGMGGMEFLRRVKEDPDLALIPVVIMTSSEAEEDIIRSYQLRVNAYITKPVGMKEFEKVMERIEDFWLMVCKLPTKA